MGFAKESDLLRLERELTKEMAELKELIKAKSSGVKKNGAKKSAAKKPVAKKSGKK